MKHKCRKLFASTRERCEERGTFFKLLPLEEQGCHEILNMLRGDGKPGHLLSLSAVQPAPTLSTSPETWGVVWNRELSSLPTQEPAYLASLRMTTQTRKAKQAQPQVAHGHQQGVSESFREPPLRLGGDHVVTLPS